MKVETGGGRGGGYCLWASRFILVFIFVGTCFVGSMIDDKGASVNCGSDHDEEMQPTRFTISIDQSEQSLHEREKNVCYTGLLRWYNEINGVHMDVNLTLSYCIYRNESEPNDMEWNVSIEYSNETKEDKNSITQAFVIKIQLLNEIIYSMSQVYTVVINGTYTANITGDKVWDAEGDSALMTNRFVTLHVHDHHQPIRVIRGKTKVHSLTISNLGNRYGGFNLFYYGYRLPDYSKPPKGNGKKNLLVINDPGTIVLDNGDTDSINITITVDRDLAVGSYFAFIAYEGSTRTRMCGPEFTFSLNISVIDPPPVENAVDYLLHEVDHEHVVITALPWLIAPLVLITIIILLGLFIKCGAWMLKPVYEKGPTGSKYRKR